MKLVKEYYSRNIIRDTWYTSNSLANFYLVSMN